MRPFPTFVMSVAVAFALPIATLAETLPMPTGPVLLTLSGDLANETTDGQVLLDLDMLKNMETKVFNTSTIWLEDAVEFTGVSVKEVLEYAGAQGTQISAVALNDYKIEIPVSDIDENAPIIAYLMDGQEMSARGKGPLWVVYPYDTDPKFQTEVVYSRSIWQLDRIVSKD